MIHEGNSKRRRGLALTVKDNNHFGVTLFHAIYLAIALLANSSVTFANDDFESIRFKINAENHDIKDNVALNLNQIPKGAVQNHRYLQHKIQEAVRKGAEPFGLYDAEVSYDIKGDVVEITIKNGVYIKWVSPEIELKGGCLTLKSASTLKAKHPFVSGQTINHRDYEDFKNQLLSACINHGFLDAHYEEAQLRIDIPNKTAQAVLILDSGGAFSIQEIQFRFAFLNHPLMRQIIPIKAGDRFNFLALEQIQESLLETSYFASIDIDFEKQANEKVIIYINGEPAPRFKYLAGLGFDTDIGPRFRMGLERPWINPSGHQMNISGEFAAKKKDASFNYRIPLVDQLFEAVTMRTDWSSKDVLDTNTQVYSIGATVEKSLFGWNTQFSVDRHHEKYTIAKELDDQSTYWLLGNEWTKRKVREVNIVPTKGFKLWLNIEGTHQGLGASNSFIKWVAGFKNLSKWGDAHQFVSRMEVGAIGTGDFDNLPTTARFYTGGDQSVRGFDFESLSPKNESGKLIGGQFLNVGSIEYRWSWKPKIKLATFVDSGRAFTDKTAPFNTGAGIGIRWLTPLGPVSLDLAKPVNNTRLDSLRLHISMGPAL